MSCVDNIPLLRLVWGRGLFPHEGLRTTTGQSVVVVNPGTEERGRIVAARVEIDGRLYQGAMATAGATMCDDDVALAVTFDPDRTC
ncbi:MAG: hypothetical protein LBH06_05100 [Rikenellaceae bacterium]|jgi:hypothetical protein|nr:hypothetical protein [Rikenellaceae bacterium]